MEQSTLVDLLQVSRAQGVGYLENSSEHLLVKASKFFEPEIRLSSYFVDTTLGLYLG